MRRSLRVPEASSGWGCPASCAGLYSDAPAFGALGSASAKASAATAASLRNARRAAAESEAVGAATLDALQAQGETLRRAHGALEDAGENLSASEKLLKKMGACESDPKP